MQQLQAVDPQLSASDGCGNNLLAALRPADFDVLRPSLKSMAVEPGQILYEPGDDVQTCYFPCGPALISFMVVMDDGSGVETALVGLEGAVGGIVSQGFLPAYARAIVQYPGTLLKLKLDKLEAAKRQSPALDGLFVRYADCLLAQIFQSVACTASHNVEQRAARWLLSAHDRTGDLRVPITHERWAELLGVGRSYISRVADALREAGAIETRRGSIQIRDLDRLGHAACPCSGVVRAHFDQVLRNVYPNSG